MADPDSLSMTPPMSPLYHLEDMDLDLPHVAPAKNWTEDFENPICFCCKGQTNPRHPVNTHADSYLQKGCLDRLLSAESVPEDTNLRTVQELFGFPFQSSTALLQHLDMLFMFLKQEILVIERESSANFDFLGTRKTIRRFFIFIKHFIVSYTPSEAEEEEKFLCNLLQQFHALLLYIGRLPDVPGHVLASVTQFGSSSHQYFHLLLDVHWAVLEILHTITVSKKAYGAPIQICSDECEGNSEMFHPVSKLLIWDITLLAILVHNKLAMGDYVHVDPFPCACVKEITIMIIHLLEHRQSKLAKQSFWVCLNPIIQCILDKQDVLESADADTSIFPLPPIYNCTDPLGFCWWFVMHMATLYHYDIFGRHAEKFPVAHNYHIIQTLVKMTLAKGNTVSENMMRCYLRCTLTISRHWETNTQILLLLWDHFYKKLNNQFLLSTGGLSDFASTSKTGTTLLEQCTRRCVEDEESLSDENSYGLFLRILSVHLKKSGSTLANVTWRQLKGRFFIKFHSRRMLELDAIGLNNFTSLFLLLASITELEDVAGKMVELYSSLDGNRLDRPRRKAVWQGMFALTMLYTERNIEAAHVTSKLGIAVNRIASEMNASTADTSTCNDLWQLVHIYLENAQEVIEGSTSLTSGEHHLIASGFHDLLCLSQQNDLRRIFAFIQAILTKHRIVYKRLGSHLGNHTNVQHRSFADALWQYIYPFVVRHAATLTPPSELADVAAGFCLLAIDIVSVRFLAHLLPNHDLVEHLRTLLDNANPFLVQAWFRCVWRVQPPSDQLQQVTRLIMKLPEVTKIMGEGQVDLSDMSYDIAAVKYVKALGKHYSSLKDLQSKVHFQAQVKVLLGDVPKHIATILKSCQSPDLVRLTYSLAGHMVKYCHNLLYNKSRPDCLLPVLVDRLILPRSITMPSKTAPPQPLISAMREYLYLFLQGLGSLDYQRDPYVQRKIKDIITHHMTRFPLMCLSPSCSRNASPENIQFRKYFIGVLVKEYLTLQGSVSANAGYALNLLFELAQRTTNKAQVVIDSGIVLASSLNIQVLSDNPTLRQQGMTLTQCLIDASKKHPELSKAAHILQSFTEQYLKIFHSRALKIIENISMIDADLVVKVIPIMTQGVRDSEAKRGVGIDKQLRLNYCKLLQNLGEAGRAERSLILQESAS